MTNVLVTGGAGFIGSHLVDSLVAQGNQVRVVDNLCTGNLSNLDQSKEQIDFFEIDINDQQKLAAAMQGVEVVFHQAALASVPLSIDKPQLVNKACVQGTLNVLEVAKDSGVRRLVYAASSSCYGDNPFAAKRETDTLQTLSPYAAAKLAGEFYCQAFFHSYGLETVGIRYFNVFGPRQDPDSPYSAVIPLFITWMLNGESPKVYGDGLQSRDFTFVQNVVDANLLAAQVDGIGGRVFNVANGKSIDLVTLIKLLNRELRTEIEPHHLPPRVGDVRESLADINSAMRDLGYEPGVSFEEGLKKSIDYYRLMVQSSN